MKKLRKETKKLNKQSTENLEQLLRDCIAELKKQNRVFLEHRNLFDKDYTTMTSVDISYVYNALKKYKRFDLPETKDVQQYVLEKSGNKTICFVALIERSGFEKLQIDGLSSDSKEISILEKIPYCQILSNVEGVYGARIDIRYFNVIYTLFPHWNYSTISSIEKTKLSQKELKQALRHNEIWFEDNEFRLRISGLSQADRSVIYSLGFEYNKTKQWWSCYSHKQTLELIQQFPQVKVTKSVNERIQQIQRWDNQVESVVDVVLRKFNTNEIFVKDEKEIQYFEYQKDSIIWKLSKPFHLDGHDMGLGKTLMSLIVAREYQRQLPEFHVIVICPAKQVGQWVSESIWAGLQCSVYSWSKIPEPSEIEMPFFLIVDEGHKMKDDSTKQSKACLKLAELASSVQILTGTAMKNGTTMDMYPLLRAIRFTEAQSKLVYTRLFGYNNRTQQLLLSELIEPYFIQKFKKDCLDLKPKTRITVDVKFDEESEALYQAKYKEFMTKYEDRLKAGLVTGGAEQLVEALAVRHANSIGKVSAAYDLIQKIVDSKYKVVVFAEFTQTLVDLKHLLMDLGVKVYYLEGGLDGHKAQKLQNEFAKDETGVFMCTTKTGGVGLNLQTASYVVMIDYPWTPGDTVQAEDRVYRIGQDQPVFIYRLMHGIDYYVYEILEEKIENINTVLKSETTLD